MQLRKLAELQAAATTVGSLPVQVNLLFYQGDDFYLRINVTDKLGAPIDLTAYTPKAQIRSSPGSGVIQATFTASIVAPNGVMLHLPSAQSVLVASAAAWDVQITDSAGVITTIAYGSVSCTREVTT
jgi:hypothetical protein